MAALVKLHPYEFEASFLAKDSPREHTVNGTINAVDEECAMKKVEDMYKASVMQLKAVKVTAKWPDKPGTTISRTHYTPSTSKKACEHGSWQNVCLECNPKFRLQDMEGMEKHAGWNESDVKPFTYKEKSNDE